MSVLMSSLPGTVAAVQSALNGTNESAASGSTPSAGEGSPQSKAEGGFSSLFQRLLQKETSPPQNPYADATPEEAGLTAEDLNALLPFLEAMGLINQEAENLSDDEEAADTLAAEVLPQGEGALAAITPDAAAATAFSAADGMDAATGQTGMQIGNAASGPEKSSLQTIAGIVGQSGEPAGGRDFSATLLTATEASGEPTQTPGSLVNSLNQPGAESARNSLPVAQAVGSPGWSEEIGNRVVWMANRQEGRAELVLTPPQMGRIEVSLSVTGNQATASFVSANPAVRDALADALPRLREVLAEAGIQLGQSQVGAENAQQSAQQEKNRDNFGADRNAQHAGGESRTDSGSVPATAGLKMGRGLVDVFA